MQFKVLTLIPTYLANCQLNFFSDRCNRGTVKVGKKDSIKLRCWHEEIVRIFSGPTDTMIKTVVCANCQQSFDSRSGGKCKHCKDLVQYCTAKCQVKQYMYLKRYVHP